MNFLIRYTSNSEMQYVEKLIPKLNWFVENGYKVSLPERIDEQSTKEEIENIIQKEFKGNQEKIEEIKTKVEESIEKSKEQIDMFFSRFNYEVPETVNVYFTAYGPGGSYYLIRRL